MVRGVAPASHSVSESWSRGKKATPPPAIGPEWSAGRREWPRELLDPMSWPGGEEVIPSLISLKKIDCENECFLDRSHAIYLSLPANFYLCNFVIQVLNSI